jgi:flagellar motility protein MotE (MotC chaperone)
MSEPEGGSPAKSEGSSAGAAGSKSHLVPILGAVIVFVVFVMVFSLKYGVFSSSNVKPLTLEQAVQQAAQGKAKADSVAAAEEAKKQDSITAAEAEAEAYDKLFTDFNEQTGFGEPEAKHDTAAVNDSVSRVQWYETQKAEIASKTAEMDAERAQLQSLKSEVETLLQRKKSMEEGNIAQMAKLYEGMATEELVPILEKLTDAQVSIMISKMKKQKAAEVLGKMAPERAAKITQYILSMSEN